MAGIALFLPFLMATLSCSNTKDNLFNRTCHNLSAHYNGYFNSRLKMREAEENLANAHTEAYDRPLRVFPYGDANKAKAIYPLLEDAMKRTTAVIQRHTIIDKRGNEKPLSEKWIDDNWLVYGQAQFFKHDYFEAMETFKYIESTYRKENSRLLASMWIAKTYLELTQLNEAEAKLDYVRNQSDFPKKNKWELYAVNADFYLQVKNIDKAAEFLAKAADITPEREKKIRYRFILAQLYQQKGEFDKAFALYTKVIKMTPKYDMAFNARLNRARCADSKSDKGESVRKELMRMQKDPKNKDYLDQIYFALAGLAKNDGDEEKRIEFLNLSVRSSTNNANQKALSYLELGKIAYEKPDYRRAQAYYDSTITSLSTDYPDYTEILNKRNSLTKLIKNLRTIETEDSLQRLAKLSPQKQQEAINSIFEREAEKKKEEEAKQSNQQFDPMRTQEANTFNTQSGSNWYFYNAQAISFGFNEFQKKFGDRKLEDNWRRSSKQTALADLPEDTEDKMATKDSTEKTADPKVQMEKRRQDLLKAIPTTDSALVKSTNKIIEAYYNAAMIYKEQLNDMDACVKMFEELVQRFPESKYKLQTYYQLYRTYAKMGNTVRSDYYKNIILNQYGDTEYAEIIRNPNYGTEKANRKSNLELFYEETYRKYLNGEYAAVISRKTQADSQFPGSPLVPKFDMLKALSIGRTQSLPVFEAALNDIIRNYGNDPVKDQAQDILDFIHNSNGSPATLTASANNTPAVQPGKKDEPSAQQTSPNAAATSGRTYVYAPDTAHCVVLIFQNIGGPIDPVKIKSKLSDFNSRYFGQKSVTMQDFLFDHRLKIIVLRSFNNKSDVMNYVNTLFDNDEVFGNLAPDNYELYAVSVNNLPELLKQKKTADYQDFYRSFYR